MDKKNKLKIVGTISNHQWGIVYTGKSLAPTECCWQFKMQNVVIRKWERKSSS